MAATSQEIPLDTTQEQQRGRELQRGGNKGRGKSKAPAIDSLEPRVAVLEASMASLESNLDQTTERVEGMETEYADLSVAIRKLITDQAEILQGELLAFQKDVQGLRSFVQDELRAIRAEVEDVRTEWARHKSAFTANHASSSSHDAHLRLKVPKPNTYDGTRNATMVDNFIFNLDRYFKGMGVRDDATKIDHAPNYLCGAASSWWRRKCDDMDKGICTIETWADFLKELRKQFAPSNAERDAKAKLRRLKQTGSLQDYINEFNQLMFEITDMTDKDALFFFTDGLKDWAKVELDRHGVQTLSDAIAKAESLTDYFPQARDKKPNHDKGEEEARHEGREGDNRKSWGNKKPPNGKDGHDRSEGRKEPPKPRTPCFICDGPHWVRDCPQKKTLNAIVAQTKPSSASTEERQCHMGSIQLLSTLSSDAPTPTAQKKGLMYVRMTINGQPVCAMLDTGATHNFISDDEAKRLGLKTSKDGYSIKVVNSSPTPTTGRAGKVPVTIGTWESKLDFSIIPLREYKVILGMEFFRKANAILMPSTDSLTILDKSHSCVIPLERMMNAGDSSLTAIQLVGPQQRYKHKCGNHRRIKQVRAEDVAETGGGGCRGSLHKAPCHAQNRTTDVRAQYRHGHVERPIRARTRPRQSCACFRHSARPHKALPYERDTPAGTTEAIARHQPPTASRQPPTSARQYPRRYICHPKSRNALDHPRNIHKHPRMPKKVLDQVERSWRARKVLDKPRKEALVLEVSRTLTMAKYGLEYSSKARKSLV